MSELIRVLLADDHAVVRRGIRSVLDQHPDLHVVKEVSTAEEALRAVAELDPDVALLDIGLSGPGSADGIIVTRRLKKVGSRPRIAILTAFDEREYVIDAFRAGADAYILKSASEDNLVDAIRSIHAGERFVSGPILGTVLDEFEDLARWRVQKQADLSDDDVDILRMLSEGATISQIGAALFCSDPTAKRKLRALFEKLGVPNRAQAVVESMRRGLI